MAHPLPVTTAKSAEQHTSKFSPDMTQETKLPCSPTKPSTQPPRVWDETNVTFEPDYNPFNVERFRNLRISWLHYCCLWSTIICLGLVLMLWIAVSIVEIRSTVGIIAYRVPFQQRHSEGLSEILQITMPPTVDRSIDRIVPYRTKAPAVSALVPSTATELDCHSTNDPSQVQDSTVTPATSTALLSSQPSFITLVATVTAPATFLESPLEPSTRYFHSTASPGSPSGAGSNSPGGLKRRRSLP